MVRAFNAKQTFPEGRLGASSVKEDRAGFGPGQSPG